MGRDGKRRGGREGRVREGMEEGRGKVTEGMGGSGQDMGEGKGKGKVEGKRGGEGRATAPQTSIPGAGTVYLVRCT